MTQQNKKTVAIVGNPNCGKTVLFNALTGSKQKVGNWSGVTVDRKSGHFDYQDTHFNVVDLPGCYSLSVVKDVASIDERIACRYVLTESPDVVINIIDGSNLERNLYLTVQLLEMQAPVIVVVNMLDIAKRRGIHIDLDALSKRLNCPVLGMVANRKQGLSALKQRLLQPVHRACPLVYQWPEKLSRQHQKIADQLKATGTEYPCLWLAQRLLENDALVSDLVSTEFANGLQRPIKSLGAILEHPIDVTIANSRYAWIKTTLDNVMQAQKVGKNTLTDIIDNVVLNRFLGIPIFLGVMYLMFLFAINIGGAFQDFFDIGSTVIFIDGFSNLMSWLHFPDWLNAILANGLGTGINTVISFIPIIGGMFLFLSLLEDSGYMARAAFVVDRLMRAIGLPGKAFVPLIVGFGCNVPTVMATRTLGSQRDRILTVMMAPFMSCGARLAVYAVFVGAFFPQGGQNIIFLLYLIGILVAVGTGLLLRITHFRGASTPMIMELPAYHRPHTMAVLHNSWHRLKMFLKKAGRFIIPICVLLGTLNSIGLNGQLLTEENNQASVLSTVGKTVTPVFEPMGLKQENWPATVGLLSGLLAKEVVVGTLNTLYSQVGNVKSDEEDLSFWQGLQVAVMSIPENLAQLGDALLNPVAAYMAPHHMEKGAYGVMYRYFDGKIGAFAYLLFLLLYFPCISTLAVMRREIGHAWSSFSMVWTTGLAYSFAVMFYQAATWLRHPVTSSLWIVGILTVLLTVLLYMRHRALKLPAGPRVIPIQLVQR